MNDSIKKYTKNFLIDPETDSEFRKALSYSRCNKCIERITCKGLDLYGKCKRFKRDLQMEDFIGKE